MRNRTLLVFCVVLALFAWTGKPALSAPEITVDAPVVEGATLEVEGAPSSAVVDFFSFSVDYGNDGDEETSFDASPSTQVGDGYYVDFAPARVVLRQGANSIRFHAVSTDGVPGPERNAIVNFVPAPPTPTPVPTPTPPPPAPSAFKIKGLKLKPVVVHDKN